MDTRAIVMLVDDDPSFRTVVREVLSAEGCRTYEASNGREALELIRRVRPDLILLDLMMPTMNGWEVLAALKRDRGLSRIPVIILSAAASSAPARSKRVLPKPAGLAALLECVDAATGHRASHA